MLDGNRAVTVARRKLENEMFTFEGEKRSLENRKADIQTQISHAKKEIIRLESEITELELSKNSLEHRILNAEEEMARIKRKINLL